MDSTKTARKDYLQWDEYFMGIALLTAKRSKDPDTQVGACIVTTKNKLVSVGYNGMPGGLDHKLPWNRKAENKKDEKYLYVSHAELNAYVNKSTADVTGCSIYVTLFPCNECAKLLIQAGIKNVIYLSDKYHDTPETTASKRLLELANINHRQFVPKVETISIDFTLN